MCFSVTHLKYADVSIFCLNRWVPYKSSKTLKEVLNFLYKKIYNLQVVTISNKHLFIISLVTMYLLAFSTNNIAVASYEYHFIEQISWTICHRNLFDPVEKQKVSFLLWLYFTNRNDHTIADSSMFFAISVKN